MPTSPILNKDLSAPRQAAGNLAYIAGWMGQPCGDLSASRARWDNHAAVSTALWAGLGNGAAVLTAQRVGPVIGAIG